MPTIAPDPLRDFTAQCFAAAGVPAEDAALVARLMVEANLKGHDTHGVRQLSRYLALVEKGVCPASAEVKVVRETPATAVLDAQFALGFIGAAKATQLVTEKARAIHIAAVGVRNLNHVGRVGAYTEQIAAAGLVGIATVNGQGPRVSVAPFGGAARKLATNPISAAFPMPGGQAPVLLDFATSAVAANKIRQAHTRGKPLGHGWVLRPDGSNTADPLDFLDRDAVMQPLGGEQGHKGYGLAVLVDILSGILAGAGAGGRHDERTDLNNGTFLIAIDPEAFLSRDEYEERLAEYVAYLRDTPPSPGKPAVQIPGDYEANHAEQRDAYGIEIEEAVWADMLAAAERVKVPAPVLAPPPPAR